MKVETGLTFLCMSAIGGPSCLFLPTLLNAELVMAGKDAAERSSSFKKIAVKH